MTRTLRNAALAAVLTGALFNTMASIADQPASASGSGTSLPSDQLRSQFDQLSPEAKAALMKQLQNAGDLSKMTPEQIQNSFNGLPPEVQAQLRQKWDSLSDEQKAALKKMDPAALKQMAMDQMKQMLKPLQDSMQKAKDFIHKLYDKLFGHGGS